MRRGYISLFVLVMFLIVLIPNKLSAQEECQMCLDYTVVEPCPTIGAPCNLGVVCGGHDDCGSFTTFQRSILHGSKCTQGNWSPECDTLGENVLCASWKDCVCLQVSPQRQECRWSVFGGSISVWMEIWCWVDWTRHDECI